MSDLKVSQSSFASKIDDSMRRKLADCIMRGEPVIFGVRIETSDMLESMGAVHIVGCEILAARGTEEPSK